MDDNTPNQPQSTPNTTTGAIDITPDPDMMPTGSHLSDVNVDPTPIANPTITPSVTPAVPPSAPATPPVSASPAVPFAEDPNLVKTID